MVELADAPQATNSEMDEITPDQHRPVLALSGKLEVAAHGTSGAAQALPVGRTLTRRARHRLCALHDRCFGNVLSASLARSSGFSDLDQEVLRLVRRASPVPCPGQGRSQKDTVAPDRFDLGPPGSASALSRPCAALQDSATSGVSSGVILPVRRDTTRNYKAISII